MPYEGLFQGLNQMTTPISTAVDALCASPPPQLFKSMVKSKQIPASPGTFPEAQATSSRGHCHLLFSGAGKASPVVEVRDSGLHCPLMQPVPATLALPLQIRSVHFSPDV